METRVNILIVDDIFENRELLKNVISEFNANIHEAENGLEAIKKTNKQQFDIILMDVMMPEMDGYESTKQIKQIPFNANATIIFITAHDQERETVEQAFESGGIDFLFKPIDVNELKRLLSLYIRFILKEKQYNQKLTETNSQLKKTNTYLKEEISKRKKVEVQFLKSQESFKNIVGKSEAAILIINKEGVLKFMNKAAEIVFGRTSDELVGSNLGYIAQFNSKAEINIFRKNGTVGTGEITTTTTSWEDEPAWLILVNDITEHKKLQEHLEKAKEKAQESDRLKSAFLSNMSHEIRTPMNGIVGFLDFVENEENKEKRKEYTNIIRNSSNHLLSLINDIIDISKIEAGQLDIRYGECHLEMLLIDLYNFFINNHEIQKKGISIALDCPVEKEETIINTDKERINQVLTNLIGNAIKFTTEGSITFGFKKKGEFLEFYVKDTGKGIPKDKISHIFNRFSQILDEDTTTLTQGTGLGLAISKSLVTLLNGEIWVESEMGKGSVFKFTIPFIQIKQKRFDLKNSEKRLENLNSLNDRNVLIVEDIETNYNLLNAILSTIKINTKWAKDGFEAVELSKSNNIDLILMDIKMPGKNGLDATQEIRKFNTHVPIIAQTAYALEGEKEKCLEAGCNAYISKPIDKDKLIQILLKYI